MEIEQQKKVMVQGVKKLLSVILLLWLIGCNTISKPQQVPNSYVIEKYKSIDRSNYISINSFSYEDRTQRIPAYYRINKLVLNSIQPKTNFTINVLEGVFQIEAGFISKEEIQIKDLKVEKGDSIAVKIFLKDDPEPLY